MSLNTNLFRADEFFHCGTPIVVNWARHDSEEYPEQPRRLNRREFWKIFYVLEGNAELSINGRLRALRPGFIGLCHPNDLTAYEVPRNIEIYNVLFLARFLTEDLKRFSDESDFFSIFRPDFDPNESLNHERLHLFDSNRNILFLIRRMYREFESGNANSVEMLHAQLIELLIALSRISARKYPWQRREGLVDLVDSYLTEHAREPIHLDELARQIGYSRSHLHFLYRSQAGHTIGETLLEIRLKSACDLLDKSDFPAVKICWMCGFGDVGNFYRFFRRALHMTPREYRERRRVAVSRDVPELPVPYAAPTACR